MVRVAKIFRPVDYASGELECRKNYENSFAEIMTLSF